MLLKNISYKKGKFIVLNSYYFRFVQVSFKVTEKTAFFKKTAVYFKKRPFRLLFELFCRKGLKLLLSFRQ